MYLECAHGLACPPSLWRYRLNGWSSASDGLSPWFHDPTLGDCLPEAELKPTTFSSLPLLCVWRCRLPGFSSPLSVFPLLLTPQRYSTCECCLLGLLLNNNNNINIKKEKHWKVEVKRKWWVAVQPPYSPQGNGRRAPGWKPTGDRPPSYEKNNPGSRYRQRLGGQASINIFLLLFECENEKKKKILAKNF